MFRYTDIMQPKRYGRHTWTNEERHKIIAMKKKGYTYTEISKKTGFTFNQITNLVARIRDKK